MRYNKRMKLNKFNQTLVDSSDIFQGLYAGKITNLDELNIEDQGLIAKFNQARSENADQINDLSLFQEPNISIEEFDKNNQATWFIPKEYQDIDIAAYILEQCTSDVEKARVLQELELFFQHNMIEVLNYLKYLVDTMRTNNVVWGVGRGSSVASYCLYLLGVHKVNSIQYDLDIHEFLKEK